MRKCLGCCFSLLLNGDFDHRVANDLVFDPVALLEYLDDLARSSVTSFITAWCSSGSKASPCAGISSSPNFFRPSRSWLSVIFTPSSSGLSSPAAMARSRLSMAGSIAPITSSTPSAKPSAREVWLRRRKVLEIRLGAAQLIEIFVALLDGRFQRRAPLVYGSLFFLRLFPGRLPGVWGCSAVWGASSSVTGVSGFLSFFFMPSSYLLSESSWLIAPAHEAQHRDHAAVVHARGPDDAQRAGGLVAHAVAGGEHRAVRQFGNAVFRADAEGDLHIAAIAHHPAQRIARFEHRQKVLCLVHIRILGVVEQVGAAAYIDVAVVHAAMFSSITCMGFGEQFALIAHIADDLGEDLPHGLDRLPGKALGEHA